MSELNREVLPIMLGTAGHVDHGKTSLVKQLTAWDTDSAKEERERGVSIDFGVAPFHVGETSVTGIIDVPGHIDYIRNMVAGVSAIDLLMLVVAADDGVMPQTIEHMQIAALMGLKRLVVVLTKCDLVDADTKELAEMEVSEFLQTLGYEDVPCFHVSSETGEGIPALREFLVQEVGHTPAQDEDRPFRMFVRKAFTMKGFGTVVTGVPLSGTAADDAELELVPEGRKVRLRGVQNYRSSVPKAQSHVSCALNVRDAVPEDFLRGMALVTPGSYFGLRSLLVSVKNVSELAIGQQNREPILRLHIGTAAVPVKVRGSLGPAESGFLELRSLRPFVAAPGDHFVLRALTTSVTLGGGLILAGSTSAQSQLLAPERNRRALEALEQQDLYTAALWSAEQPLITTEAVRRYVQSDADAVSKQLQKRAKRGELISLDASTWLILARIEELATRIDALLKRYHKSNPETLGMREEFLCDLLGVPRSSFARLWQELQKLKLFRYEKSYIARNDFKASVSPEELEQRDKLLAMLQQQDVWSLARGTVIKELGIAEKDFRKLSKRLSDAQQITVFGGSVIAREKLRAIEQKLLSHFQSHAELELKDFRDTLGIGRNAAVELLEHFDAVGLTKRHPNGGRILNRRQEQ